MSEILNHFYRVERAGQVGLSDGGGPFGFDVTLALLVDDIVAGYRCDVIVETGCYLGDTTAYLAAAYAGLPIYSCDVWAPHAAFTGRRVRGCTNVTVSCHDSPDLIAQVIPRYRRPLFFLDAHGGAQAWPLARELAAITNGIAVIHDFDVGHPRFAYDTYDGVVCGPDVLAAMACQPEVYFTPDPLAEHPLPCLQTGRRAGVGIVAIGVDALPLREHSRLNIRQLATRKAVNV